MKLIDQALTAGFTKAALLNCKTLVFHSEVRDMCSSNRCGKYGKYWTCPPACGTVEACAQLAGNYQYGLIVQLVGDIDDPFDINSMLTTGAKHRRLFADFTRILKLHWPNLLALSSGDCVFCQECTYPNLPCRFPQLAAPSMEAFGLLVCEVCEANNLPYQYEPNTITFIGCYLLA